MFSGFISTQSGVGNREEGNIFYIFMFCVCMLSRDDSFRPHGLQPARLLCPWDSQARVLEWGAIVDKVMSLLFNMLSTLIITFLPRSKCLLISCLRSPSTVILEPKKVKSVTVSTASPSICHEVMGPDASFLNAEF